MAVIKKEDGSTTTTAPYGGSSSTKTSVGKDESLDSIAERHVIEMHGEPIRDNPNFKALVKDAKKQISDNIEATKGM